MCALGVGVLCVGKGGKDGARVGLGIESTLTTWRQAGEVLSWCLKWI